MRRFAHAVTAGRGHVAADEVDVSWPPAGFGQRQILDIMVGLAA